jgi:hypothetical protein
MTRDPYRIKRAGVTTVSPRFIYMPPKSGARTRKGVGLARGHIALYDHADRVHARMEGASAHIIHFPSGFCYKVWVFSYYCAYF